MNQESLKKIRVVFGKGLRGGILQGKRFKDRPVFQ